MRPPLHVVVGDADPLVNPHLHGRTLAHMVPHSRVTIVPGVGYMVHHFAQDAILSAALQISRE